MNINTSVVVKHDFIFRLSASSSSNNSMTNIAKEEEHSLSGLGKEEVIVSRVIPAIKTWVENISRKKDKKKKLVVSPFIYRFKTLSVDGEEAMQMFGGDTTADIVK